MEILFTADEHYDHKNIIKFCNRPFIDTEEMQEMLIERHNSVATKNTVTYHLGDWFWRTVSVEKARQIIDRLKGKHYLIYGNHEETARKLMNQSSHPNLIDAFDVLLLHQPVKIWLSHYSHRVWPYSHKGSYHLFGHSHGELLPHGLSHDVGVDFNDYFPRSYEEIDAIMKRRIVDLEQPEVEEPNEVTSWGLSATSMYDEGYSGFRSFPTDHLEEGSL